MNLQEALEKLAGLLPGAERAKQLEGEKAKIVEENQAAIARAVAAEGKLVTAGEQITALQGQLSAKDGEIATLKAEHTKAIDAKEVDVEKRANLKAGAILAERGITQAIKEEGKSGGDNAESAYKTYSRLMVEGKSAEAAKFYAENSAEVIKSRNQ